MHFLMNLIGCIGILKADTGLFGIMEGAFGGVTHMLTGKKFSTDLQGSETYYGGTSETGTARDR